MPTALWRDKTIDERSLILISFSLAILGSIDPVLLQQQAINIGIGIVFFFLFSMLDYHVYSFFTWVWYALSTILLGMTFIFGTETRGSIRWIDTLNILINRNGEDDILGIGRDVTHQKILEQRKENAFCHPRNKKGLRNPG